MFFMSFVPNNVYSASYGGLKISIEMTFGTHNITSKVGFLGFGTTQDNNLAFELGAGVWAQTHLKRFGAETNGWSIGYETFGLLGVGDNSNLLGSVLSESIAAPIYREGSEKKFFGLGFGVINENITGSLNKFGLKRGKLIIRSANKTSSFHLTFANDLRQSVMRGGATDYGQTAAISIQYNQINQNTLIMYGLGFDLFTPQPDYEKEPNNSINSDEGRKRVWNTTSPWSQLFNANLFLEFGRQGEERSVSGKIGIDSPKLGAYTQNKIHDSFGLLPRYPWATNKKDKVFFEITASQEGK
jgi:hypothetical protein